MSPNAGGFGHFLRQALAVPHLCLLTMSHDLQQLVSLTLSLLKLSLRFRRLQLSSERLSRHLQHRQAVQHVGRVAPGHTHVTAACCCSTAYQQSGIQTTEYPWLDGGTAAHCPWPLYFCCCCSGYRQE
jgi:hypothetical protein